MNSSTRRLARPLPIFFVGGVCLLLVNCGGVRPPVPTAAGSAGSDSLPSCPAITGDRAPSLLACSFAATGTMPSLDDFDDGNLVLRPDEQRVGSWYHFTDETAGCAKLTVEKAESSPSLHFTGGGFSKWGAGFGVSLAWSLAQSGLCTYDLSVYSGVRFRARGNATLRMNIPSRQSAFQSVGGDCPDSEGCNDQQGRNIGLSATFQEFQIPFCSLAQRGFGPDFGPLDPTQATNLNFLVQSKNDFDVWLDDIEFVPWRDGQARDCRLVCPSDELALGVTPRPGESWLDQQATGVRLFTFEQSTKDCGPVTRRYLSYIPKALAPGSDAPVLIVLHGLGADAESMRSFVTQERFETLAERDGFIVVYGNAAPGAATVAERPNGGGFRKDLSGQSQVDDFAYLRQIIDDLAARGAISGKNPVFLSGLSDGGGMVHLAALHDPTRYRGLAALMPYPGSTVAMPAASRGFALRRVLLGYSLTDPGMPAGYAEQLAPLGPAWAAALGFSSAEQSAPRTSALPDRVNEGADYRGTLSNALLTRDSHAEQLDYGSDTATVRVRVLRFDHAGHLWPVPNPPDREQEIAEFGLRNRDLDMSDVVWEFFRSSL
ncbi:MAG TPA: hypothetical protein VJV79_02040 [Polyangiaceae bacterium]|nr:hypothetical protein [Polyangiaceae bacterium]